MLLEGLAVRVVDGVVLMRQRAVDAVHLLRHDVHPASLVAASEARHRAPAAHVVEHRDVLGDPQRVVRRQHDAELPHADPLGLHSEVQVEHDRVRRDLEALDVEVVLGKGNGVIAELVGELRLLRELPQHLLIEVRAQARDPLLDLVTRSDRG